MGRRTEDIFTRVARHTVLTADQVREFIDQKDDRCLIWNGAISRAGKPILKNIGHPVRALFAYLCGVPELDRWVFLKVKCGHNCCINPQHFRQVIAYSKREDRHGRPPAAPGQEYDEAEVQGLIEELRAGNTEILEFASAVDAAETKRRLSL